MLMAIQTPTGARLARPRLSDIELCAWIAQAEAGERIELIVSVPIPTTP